MNLFSGRSQRGLILGLAVSLFFFFSLALEARAQDQDEMRAEQQESAPPVRPRDEEINLLRLLNLTPEQVGQLRAIRQQREFEARPLARRLNQARRALDEAIYADNINEELIRERAREVAEAQAAILRLNTLAEVRVRRALTPEQLQRFRELRRDVQARQRFRRQFNRGNQLPPQGDSFNNRPNVRPPGNSNTPRERRP